MPLKKQKQYKNNLPKKNKTGDTRKNKNPKKRTQKEAEPRSFLRFFFVVFDFFGVSCFVFVFLGGYFGIVFVYLVARTLSL